MGGLSPWHLAILALVIVLLFGAKKLPDAARGLGRSMRIFKSEMKEMQADGTDKSAPQAQLGPAEPQSNAYVPGSAAYTQPAPVVPAPPATAAPTAPTDGRPPMPTPVWDPNTQQYVLPNNASGHTPPA